MDIGSICLCLVVGALIVFASIGIGACFGRNDNRDNQRQLNDDSDVRTYIPVRDRNRCGNKRIHEFSTEEMMFVLNDVKWLTHGWERDIMDAVIEKIEKDGENDTSNYRRSNKRYD
jgi:hypothetical protein